jgi:hypothetical protein
MNIPYVVAVNVLRALWDEHIIGEALFGTPAERLRLTENGEEELERFRVGDGVWRGPDGPRNTRVSAVLLVFGLDPTTVAADGLKMVLYHNPWAGRPYHGLLCRLPQEKLEGRQLVSIKGLAARNILGLKETA